MKRPLLQLWFTLGLLLALSAAWLWLRSFRTEDTISARWAHGAVMDHLHVSVADGRSTLLWSRDTSSPAIAANYPRGIKVEHFTIEEVARLGVRRARAGVRGGFFSEGRRGFRGGNTFGYAWFTEDRRWVTGTVARRERLIYFPLWLPLLSALALCAGLVALPVWRHHRKCRARAQRGLCPTCGYDLRGAEHERCPECGQDPRTFHP